MITNEKGQITFDSFIRGAIGVLILVGIVMLLNRLSNVLVPFFLAWLIAYLLFPLVKFFQYRCRMKYRFLGILCAFLVAGLVVSVVFMLMIPPMVEESLRVKDLLIAYIKNDATMSNIPQLVQAYLREHLTAEEIQSIVTQNGFLEGIKATLPKLWDIITQSISIMSSVFTLTMVALYTLLILLDYEDLTQGWPNLLPERYRGFALQLVGDVEESMNKYFRGQALVALCVGILFSIGFLIIDFPIAVGLGMFIGLLNMVPYLQLIGFVPGGRHGPELLVHHAAGAHCVCRRTGHSGHHPHPEDHGACYRSAFGHHPVVALHLGVADGHPRHAHCPAPYHAEHQLLSEVCDQEKRTVNTARRDVILTNLKRYSREAQPSDFIIIFVTVFMK